jgi:predicted NBD/HSP70 family sugar kinase
MTVTPSARLVSSDVRIHNLGVVLQYLDRNGPSARAEIADATGLVRSAMTPIIADLEAAGLIRDATDFKQPDPVPGRTGRPRRALEIDGSGFAIVAVQMSLGEVIFDVVDLAGRRLLREVHEVATPFGDAPAFADLVRDILTPALQAISLTAIPVQLFAVVTAGVTTGSSIVPKAIDLGWQNVDLGSLLGERLPTFPLGIVIVNDANVSAYAEFNALRGEAETALIRDMAYVKSNTGIGGGVVVDGKPFVGSNGRAFEPGHLVVDPDGLLCACGNRGCLVTVAGPEIVLHDAGLDVFLAERGLPMALEELLRRRVAGDRRADEAILKAARWIRLALGSIVNLLEPQALVLGGYLGGFVDDLRELPLIFVDNLGIGDLRGSAAILPATRGRFSAVEGALALGRESLLQVPSLIPQPGGALE